MNGILPFEARYSEYLRDESRLSGRADSISFPESEEELVAEIKTLFSQGVPLTVQGARTGIAGAAVPAGGHVLSLERLNRLLSVNKNGEAALAECESGLRLSELSEQTAASPDGRGLAFLPDPTETSATVGGAFSCDAKGMNAFLQGSAADHMCSARILLTDGSLLDIERGRWLFDDTGCNLPDGRRLELGALPEALPGQKGPLAVGRGSDLLDLFAGSEGTLGIVTRLGVMLERPSAEKWGVLFFLSSSQQAAGFAAEVVSSAKLGKLAPARLAAAEFFHHTSLDMVAAYKDKVTKLRAIPDFPATADCAVYLELEGDDADGMEEALMGLLEVFAELGGGEDDTWAGTGAAEMEKFKLLRHAAPESVNAAVDLLRADYPEAVKLAADFSAPMERLDETLALYEQGLASSGISGSIFGHISCNHLHVNLLPQNPDEKVAALALVDSWAARITEFGGLVVTENGVGRLKRELIKKYTPDERLKRAATIKAFFDPKGLLGPGIML